MQSVCVRESERERERTLPKRVPLSLPGGPASACQTDRRSANRKASKAVIGDNLHQRFDAGDTQRSIFLATLPKVSTFEILLIDFTPSPIVSDPVVSIPHFGSGRHFVGKPCCRWGFSLPLHIRQNQCGTVYSHHAASKWVRLGG